jgi:hypothetical protein
MENDDDTVRSQLRLPKLIYEMVKRSADLSGRSMNAEIVNRLSDGLPMSEDDLIRSRELELAKVAAALNEKENSYKALRESGDLRWENEYLESCRLRLIRYYLEIEIEQYKKIGSVIEKNRHDLLDDIDGRLGERGQVLTPDFTFSRKLINQ